LVKPIFGIWRFAMLIVLVLESGGVRLQTELHPRPRNGANIRELSLQRIDTTPRTLQHPQPARRVEFGLGAVLQYSITPRDRIRRRGRRRERSAFPLYCTRPEAKLIASASIMVLNKNDSRAWTSDKRRIPLEVMETSDT